LSAEVNSREHRPLLIYGSYGYTGRIIVEECARHGLPVLLAGRDRNKLQLQSAQTGFNFRCFRLDESGTLQQALSECSLVIHCAGPFSRTALPMAEACLHSRTHYTDITGEFTVFEALAGLDAKAGSAGIMILPGVGFDVVPSDCLALHLKGRLPDANRLLLAFSSLGGGVSRGTARTSLESFGKGGWVREHGNLRRIPLGSRERTVDFGPFTASAVCIPWGDIATAWRSTSIPNIEVYLRMKPEAIRKLRLSRHLHWLFNVPGVRALFSMGIDRRPAGPSAQKLAASRSYFWGRVENSRGEFRESRLQTYGGYRLTAITAVLVARKIMTGNFKPGFQTPATAYGETLILEVPETELKDL
jgi:short subunit dehydrogenase-like uncharacterized protein